MSATASYKDIKRIQFSELADTAKLGVQRALASREKAFESIRRRSSGEYEFRLRVAATFSSVSAKHQGRDSIRYLKEAIGWLESAIEFAPSAEAVVAVMESLNRLRARCGGLDGNDGWGGSSRRS